MEENLYLSYLGAYGIRSDLQPKLWKRVKLACSRYGP